MAGNFNRSFNRNFNDYDFNNSAHSTKINNVNVSTCKTSNVDTSDNSPCRANVIDVSKYFVSNENISLSTSVTTDIDKAKCESMERYNRDINDCAECCSEVLKCKQRQLTNGNEYQCKSATPTVNCTDVYKVFCESTLDNNAECCTETQKRKIEPSPNVIRSQSVSGPILVNNCIDMYTENCTDTAELMPESMVGPVSIHNDGVASTTENDTNVDEILNSNECNGAEDSYQILRNYKHKYPKNLILGYLNVNSVLSKFNELAIPMIDELVDVMMFAETKLDDTIRDATINIKNYKLHRNDRSRTAHGLLTYVRSDLTHRRRKDLEENGSGCQYIVIEIWLKKQKWFIVSIYKPPPVKIECFVNELYCIIDRMLTESSDILLSGDVNIDMRPNSTNRLKEFCEMYNFTNLVKEPTCFKSIDNESLIDVILALKPQRFNQVKVFDSGLSDFHKMLVVGTKIHIPRKCPRKIQYRSFKNFNDTDYKNDVKNIPFYISKTFDDVDDIAWCHEKLLADVIDSHAPLKHKTLKKDSVPFMNSELRKLIHRRNQLRNRFWRTKTRMDWENYRSIRNKTNKVRKQSEVNYFRERSQKGTNPSDFWHTFKPFLSKNGSLDSNYITLRDDNEIVNEPQRVGEIFKNHYETIANDIGRPDHFEDITDEEITSAIDTYQSHLSIGLIKDRHPDPVLFSFQTVTTEDVLKQMRSINVKKAIGYDNISPYFIKTAAEELASPVKTLINTIINQRVYPVTYKKNVVTPIYKGKDPFSKVNYRPISCSTSISKIVEFHLSDQVRKHMENLFHSKLSAYRKGSGCEEVIINVIEDWKKALDNNNTIASLLMDLSKAFDCLPHKLLIAKLRAYGFSLGACHLIASYLTNRQQSIKYYGLYSEWSLVKKGVPQGSVLGPIIYNIFVNDLLYGIKKDFYNYADDNTLSVVGSNVSEALGYLSDDANFCLNWFRCNLMKANPEKFQLILLSRHADIDNNVSLKLNDVVLKPVDSVKLLGVMIDSKLNFNEHVLSLCKKASRNLKILLRLSKRISDERNKYCLLESFILSCFTYCPVVWHFCGTAMTQRLEKVYERGIRFASCDYISDYSLLLSKCNRNTFYLTRLKKIALFVFKCYNMNVRNLNKLYATSKHVHFLRNKKGIYIERFNTITYGKMSLKYRGSKLWNSLPTDWKSVENVNDFKRVIMSWCCFDKDCQKCHNFTYHT